MTKFVLFDLDNTLVDSLHLKALRDKRRWTEVYAKITTIRPFHGIPELWEELRSLKVNLAVITHSQGKYARQTLAQVGLSPDTLVAYHDLDGKLKPSAYGYELGCKGRSSQHGIAVGDDANDLRAADAFGCVGVFAGWSRQPALTRVDCESEGWIYASRPNEVLPLLESLSDS